MGQGKGGVFHFLSTLITPGIHLDRDVGKVRATWKVINFELDIMLEENALMKKKIGTMSKSSEIARYGAI